jgi:hypothetical protein
LIGVEFNEGGLHWMKFFGGAEPLNRRDAISGMHRSERKARIDAPPVHVDRARATLTVVAPFFCAWKVEILAQTIKQCCSRVELQMVTLSVYVERHCNHAGCCAVSVSRRRSGCRGGHCG